MDVEKIFRMKGGHDETSYSRNSTLQKRGSEMVKHITMETVEQIYLATCSTPQTLSIADLGCSCGPNSLSLIRDLYRTVDDAYRKTHIDGLNLPPPKISVFLNDLPTNDFNSILKALPDLYNQIYDQEEGDSLVNPVEDEGYHRPSLFVGVSSGSFYGRLFHPNSLHVVYSSYSLHWISKVPLGIYDEHGKSMNKGCIYIGENSPPAVTLAYVQQFQEDFSKFLHLRSQELSTGGRMILVFLGRDGPNHVDRGNSFLWQLLTRSFSLLISKGQVEEQKLDSYDVHFYAASREEIEEQVRKEGSFKLDSLKMFVIEREEKEGGSYGKAVASTVRAIQEPMISHHFGSDILDPLFDIYAQLVDEEMSKQEIRPVTFLVLLSKL